MKKLKQRKGITLIALVLTIIVLIILAGITINLTIGQDGILKRAEEAGKNYTQAAEKEKTELAQFSNLTDKIIDNVTKNHYTMVNGVPVPKGFSPITTADQGTKDTGFVIKNDTDGNEFVWVPCTIDGANGSIKYDRYAFSKEGWEYNQTINTSTGEIKNNASNYVFTEAMSNDEEISVRTYGGFYIGRYETGITGYTNVDKSTDNTLNEYTGYTGGKAVIRSGEQVWNYITKDKAKKVSEELYQKYKGDSVNSKLCSSYAWDTALKFIETTNPGYSTSGTGGNYKDKTFTYTDLNGATQTKVENKSTLVPTGQTTPVNNIYDMGGNNWEWTTESHNGASTCVLRSGASGNSSVDFPAAVRSPDLDNYATDWVSFRTTLYL